MRPCVRTAFGSRRNAASSSIRHFSFKSPNDTSGGALGISFGNAGSA